MLVHDEGGQRGGGLETANCTDQGRVFMFAGASDLGSHPAVTYVTCWSAAEYLCLRVFGVVSFS